MARLEAPYPGASTASLPHLQVRFGLPLWAPWNPSPIGIAAAIAKWGADAADHTPTLPHPTALDWVLFSLLTLGANVALKVRPV